MFIGSSRPSGILRPAAAVKAASSWYTGSAMESSDAVVRRLRPASVLPFLAWAGFLVMQLISPDRAWSWPLAGFSVMLLVAYVWARTLRDGIPAGAPHAGHLGRGRRRAGRAVQPDEPWLAAGDLGTRAGRLRRCPVTAWIASRPPHQPVNAGGPPPASASAAAFFASALGSGDGRSAGDLQGHAALPRHHHDHGLSSRIVICPIWNCRAAARRDGADLGPACRRGDDHRWRHPAVRPG